MRFFIVTMTSSSFTVNQGLVLVLHHCDYQSFCDQSLNLIFIFNSQTFAISDLRVYLFWLVFFDSLAGKAFLARSIELCSVDNQQSSSVMVGGLQIISD